MQVANSRLKLNKFGSDVPINGITPAEAMFLHLIHQANAGGVPFTVEDKQVNPADPKSPMKQQMTNLTEVGVAKVQTGVEPKKVILGKVLVAACPAAGNSPAIEEVRENDTIVPEKPILREAPRTSSEEIARLRGKYGHMKTKKGDPLLNLLFPGINPTLPDKFSDIDFAALQFDGSQIGATDMGTSGGAIFPQN